MTIGGQYDVQSGRSGMEKEQEEDQEEDDVMTSSSGKGQLGPGPQWRNQSFQQWIKMG